MVINYTGRLLGITLISLQPWLVVNITLSKRFTALIDSFGAVSLITFGLLLYKISFDIKIMKQKTDFFFNELPL